ncbi:hypothetical protein [Brevundimonas sp.]|uniref:hypothetical protein n=1 Tax=Brevundimonas sp. TaxID=1871086 RepID=UPI002FC66905
MRIIIFTAMLILTISGQAIAQTRMVSPHDWTDPDLGGAILEGVGKGENIWLRGKSRKVVRFDRRTEDRTIVATDVIDLLADGPHLWALVVLNENESVVRDLLNASLHERRVYFEGSPISLFATPNGPGVLTTTMVLLPSDQGFNRRPPAASLEPYAHVSALTGDDLFIGYNKGEWGGGLLRIHVPTGTVSFVKEASDDPCRGRLNPSCAPIVGIIRDTMNANCVLVGASLAHLTGRYGEVMRVCTDRITSVFSDPLPVLPNSIVNRPGQTWPFSGLIETHDGWIAVGRERYARARGATVTMSEMPPLKPWSGLQISDPVDGVVFVQSACCSSSDSSVRYSVLAISVEP